MSGRELCSGVVRLTVADTVRVKLIGAAAAPPPSTNNTNNHINAVYLSWWCGR